MLKYYFFIAWRIMKKQKIYTLINVLGLSIGICACLVIYLVAAYDFSFDRFHKDEDRIFRITGEVQRLNGQKEFVNSVVPDVAGIETDIPGFEAKAGIYHYGAEVTITTTDGTKKKFPAEHAIVTAPDYFKIFDYQWLAGDPATALNDANAVVISEKRAQIYFGTTAAADVLNKTLVYNDSLTLSVTGVIKDWENHSDLPYTDFISLKTAENPFLKKEIPSLDWSSLRPHGTLAFVKIDKNTSKAQVDKRLKDYLNVHAKAAFYGKLVKLELQSIKDIHFTKVYDRADDGDGFRKAHLPTLYILIGVALFVLILAVLNFVNLSTALSIRRTKEIGMRKVMGAGRTSLSLQLYAETFLFTALAVIVACLITNPVIKYFHDYVPGDIHFSMQDKGILFFLVCLTVLTTLFAGAYPAKVLSSLMPVLSLKGLTAPTSRDNSGLRKSLIVFQFAVSLLFIIGTLVINSQIDYMRSKDKGFKTDAVLTINNWGDQQAKMSILKNRVKKIPGVENAILQADAPMGFAERSNMFKYKGERTNEIEVIVKAGGTDFIPFYKMKLVAGQNLNATDSSRQLVINEACVKAMGLTDPREAIGKNLYGNDNNIFPVVGVVADFHTGSFRSPIRPMVIQHFPDWETSMAVSISSVNKNVSQIKPIIDQIQKEWKQIYPDQDIRYNFLDESIGWLFEKEMQVAWLMNAATVITIFISCMGLFGLAMYTAQRRTKEIGIRKVLGASVTDIAGMLSKEFGKLVVIATVIASPLAWLIMNSWLQNFTYRTALSPWIFIAALIIGLAIALLTIMYQSVKAGLANPVKNLRTE
jgi:ABC-type antimicrobial peptide transport system permease subunit